MRFSGITAAGMRLGMIIMMVASVNSYAVRGRSSETTERKSTSEDVLVKVKTALEAQRAQRGNSPSVEPLLKEISDHVKERNALDEKIKDAESEKNEAKKAELIKERERLDNEADEIAKRRGFEIGQRLTGTPVMADLKEMAKSQEAAKKGFAFEVVSKSNQYSGGSEAVRAEAQKEAVEKASAKLGINAEQLHEVFNVKDPVAEAMYMDSIAPLVNAASGHSEGEMMALKGHEVEIVKSAIQRATELARSEGRPVSAESLRAISGVVANAEGGSPEDRQQAMLGLEREVNKESNGRGKGIVDALKGMSPEVEAELLKRENGKQIVATRKKLIKSLEGSNALQALEALNAKIDAETDALENMKDPAGPEAAAKRKQLDKLNSEREVEITKLEKTLRQKGNSAEEVEDFTRDFSEEGRLAAIARLLAETEERMKQENPKATPEERQTEMRRLGCQCGGGPKSLFCRVAQNWKLITAAGLLGGVGTAAVGGGAICKDIILNQPKPGDGDRVGMCVSRIINTFNGSGHKNESHSDNTSH